MAPIRSFGWSVHTNRDRDRVDLVGSYFWQRPHYSPLTGSLLAVAQRLTVGAFYLFTYLIDSEDKFLAFLWLQGSRKEEKTAVGAQNFSERGGAAGAGRMPLPLPPPQELRLNLIGPSSSSSS